jgi:radical SAM superfamily enzyme YgiQ (UPF0313 family)
MPPLGLAWMAAVLERQGHHVHILDAHAERVNIDRFPDRLRELGQFNIIGITATTALINNALEIARMAKAQQPASKVVLGGVHPTVLPEEVLAEKAVDLVVRGEGENTILDIASEKPFTEIDGISFRIDRQVQHNPERALIKNLDTIGMPAWHLLPMDKYYPAAGTSKRLPAISMLTTRGCPGRCTFCYRIFGQRLRVRSGRKIAEEVKYLQDNYGIREICFYDDTFTVHKKEVYAFCQGLDELGVDITWSCFSRVDTVNEDLLATMKECGCHQIMYGIESASPAILKNIGKRTESVKAEEAVRITRKVGIDVRAAFMLGNPGETKETLEETLTYAIKLNPEIAIFNITTPFPGTEMFDWAKANGYLTTTDWEDYDLANPVMELPTISSEQIQQFYQKAYRKFFLRPSYLAMRIAKIRSVVDLIDAGRALKAVVST